MPDTEHDRVYLAGDPDNTPNQVALHCRATKQEKVTGVSYHCTRLKDHGGNHAAGAGEFIAAVREDSDAFAHRADLETMSAMYRSATDREYALTVIFGRAFGAR